MAERAVEQCTGRTGVEKVPCYEQLLLPLVKERGVETVMATLGRVASLDSDVARDGHVLAHGIGIAAYSSQEDVARTFARCSPAFQSGCYHGIIQAYFEHAPASSAEAVNELCAPYRGAAGNRWLLFQCVHGMGHGLTMVHGHVLPEALRGCDLLSDGWDREACYGGAFMENIVNATAPHHAGAGLMARQGSTGSSHAAHAHGVKQADSAVVAAAAPQALRFKALDPADPHYPCSILEERYQLACYGMQTSAMLHLNGGDIAAAAGACDGAPPPMRAPCYQSLGRDISSYTLQDPDQSIRLCSLGSERYRPWCFVGLVKNFVDLTATTESAFAFCAKVPSGPSRMKCHEALGEQIGILKSDLSERSILCDRSERGYVEACRFGARLIQERPAGLPLPANGAGR
ncbi:MAG: hypothetical protein H0V09_05665 [Gemmatimonadetes bacterium]|nr:hypothetical protein [Gemmatimonadota bacterium]